MMYMGYITVGKGKNRRVIYIDDRPSVSKQNSSSIDDSYDDLTFARQKSDEIERHEQLRQRQILFDRQKKQQEAKQKKQEHEKLQEELEKQEKRLKELLKHKQKSQKIQSVQPEDSKQKSIRLIATTSIKLLSVSEPSMAGIYLSYRFAKYGFHFVKKLQEEFQKTNNWDDALLNTLNSEIRGKIQSLLKNNQTEKALHVIMENVYYKFSKSGIIEIPPEYEQPIKESMIDTLHYFVVKSSLESNPSENDFKQALLHIYLVNLIEHSSPDRTQFLSPEWKELEQNLSKRLLDEFEETKLSPYSYVGGEFDGKKWFSDNINEILELA